MRKYHKGDNNANGRSSIFDVSNDCVKRFAPERKKCFPGKWHDFDSDIDKLSPKNLDQDKLLPETPSQAQLCFRYSRCYIRFH